MNEIRLTQVEVWTGAVAGVAKRIKRFFNDDVPDQYGLDESKGGVWEYDIISTLAEMVFHKWRNLYFVPRLDYKKGDCGPYEIRSTPVPKGHLLLHDEDKDESPYVLIVGSIDKWRLAGWIPGKDGKDPQYWGDKYNTGRPCYWIPQSALMSMALLPSI